MKLKLEDVCERGSSSLKQSDILGMTGDYPIYGASGYIGNVDFYHQEKPYVANMIYLMYHINFMDISIWVTGIDQKKLNRANLDTIPIALPPIELQEQFAAFVHQVDKSKLLSLIKLLEQLITYLYNVFIIYRQDKGEEVEKYE